MGRRRRARRPAVPPGEHLRDPAGRPPAQPHLDERADDVPHHVMEERVGGHQDADAMPRGRRRGPRGPCRPGSRPRPGAAQNAAKSCLPRRRRQRPAHRADVERTPDVPGVTPEERPGHRAGLEEVAVALEPRGAARVEVGRDGPSRQHADVPREARVEGGQDRPGGERPPGSPRSPPGRARGRRRRSGWRRPARKPSPRAGGAGPRGPGPAPSARRAGPASRGRPRRRRPAGARAGRAARRGRSATGSAVVPPSSSAICTALVAAPLRS